MDFTPEQVTLLVAAGAALVYAMSYAVRTSADIGSKRAEKDRLAAEVSANLATAVAKQLENLGHEVRRLSEKLQITEDQLKEANRKLDELGVQLRNQDTASKKIADDLQSRIDELRKGFEAIKKYSDGTEVDAIAALKRDDESK